MRKKSTVSVLRTVCLILCAAFMLVTLSGCSDIFNSLSLDDVSSIFNGDDFSGWFDNDGNTGNDTGDDDVDDSELIKEIKENSGDVYCYYYDQLSSAQKKLYNGMLAKMLKGEAYATAETTLSVAESQAAAKALLYDRRDLYEYGGWGCTYYGGSRYVAVSKYDYWEYNSASASQKESLHSAAMEIAKYANEHCTTDYEKALYVHDYIVQNCRYYTEAAEAVTNNPNGYPSRYDRIFTAYGCLVDKNAVCAGYASAYKYILDILGIDCVYVTGQSMNVSHAWNRITIDGQKYYVDMTWDDPDRSYYPKSVYYQYFNITTDDLLRDHSIDADFPHPVCKELKYNYFYYNNYVIEEYDYGTFCDMVNAQKEKAAVNIRFADPSDAAAAENDFITNKGYTSFSWLGSYFEYYFDNVNGYAVILVE